MKVIVSVTNNLVTDQRIERVCQSFHDWGFDVLLVGRTWPGNPAINRPYQVKRFRLVFNKNFLFYAEYNLRLFFLLLFHKADILLANDLDTLPANYLAVKLKRCKLYFDSHEYFSETPEVYKRKFVRNFWLTIERLFIKGCDEYYTVSGSVADIYYSKYQLKFHVIRNVPLRYTLPETKKTTIPVILYQGSINPGRGLELMIETMPLLEAHLLIVGDGPELVKLKELVSRFNLENKVEFTGRLLPNTLRSLTSTATVGISIEEPLGLSYISALPNKLFDYIQARVPVLVSDFPEMRKIVSTYNIGMVLKKRTPEALASVLTKIIYEETLRKEWEVNLEKAAIELCWEKESLKLKELFKTDN